jgi:hypothetical protein
VEPIYAVAPADAEIYVALITLVGTIAVGIMSARTRKEFKPNGGASVADKLNRIEARQDSFSDRLDVHALRTDEIGKDVLELHVCVDNLATKLDDHIIKAKDTPNDSVSP